jgi:hypothetical protein
MRSILTGQLILGTDKRNPLFTVYVEEEEGDEERLHVYYGLELLEVVSADRNDPSYKMLVGRLHNAGVSLRVLQQTFQSDAKTMSNVGDERSAAAMRKSSSGCWKADEPVVSSARRSRPMCGRAGRTW